MRGRQYIECVVTIRTPLRARGRLRITDASTGFDRGAGGSCGGGAFSVAALRGASRASRSAAAAVLVETVGPAVRIAVQFAAPISAQAAATIVLRRTDRSATSALARRAEPSTTRMRRLQRSARGEKNDAKASRVLLFDKDVQDNSSTGTHGIPASPQLNSSYADGECFQETCER